MGQSKVPHVHRVKIPEKVIEVQCGTVSSLAVAGAGEKHLYLWGSGANGQLGSLSNDTVWEPRKLESLPRDFRVEHVACGDCHTIV